MAEIFAIGTRARELSNFGERAERPAMDVLSRPAEEFVNDETVERLWATKAIEHGDVYFNILRSVDPKSLKLTPHDDLIYSHLRQDFPELSVRLIDEDELKSPAGKERWRPFCEKFKRVVEDYSFGTLMRANAADGYSSENVMLVTRIQFYAIEIARNREGINDDIRKLFPPTGEELERSSEERTERPPSEI